MSEFGDLKNGFVNWRGQRVFVPWFGAPRIVPAAVDEVRILKLRFCMDYVPILLVLLFLAIAWWIGGVEYWVTMAVLTLGLGLFGFAVFLAQRLNSHWPQLSAVPFNRSRFMVGYHRGLPFADRVREFALGVGGLIFVSRTFDDDFWARLDAWGDWLVSLPNLAGFGLLVFLLSRHTMVTLISLLPRIHRRTVEKAS